MALAQKLFICPFFTDPIPHLGMIKQNADEFIVREIDPKGIICDPKTYPAKDIPGLYIHALLCKKNLDTLTAIKRVASLLHTEESNINAAGLKDSMADTVQRISIWNNPPKKIKKINIETGSQFLRLQKTTSGRYAIKPGDLWGNHFKILVNFDENNSNLVDTKSLINRFQRYSNIIKKQGCPNYFGLQRFGGNRAISHLVGKYFLQKNYKKAVETLLFANSEYEPSFIQNIRVKRDLDAILNLPSHYSIERILANSLLTLPNNYLSAIQKLPESYTNLFFAAFQSFIFNKILSQHIKETKEQNNQLESDCEIPLIGYKTKLSAVSDQFQSLIQEELDTYKIKLSDFQQKQINSFVSKGTTRKAMIKPKNILITESQTRNAIWFAFDLPKGSYATVFLRNYFELGLPQLLDQESEEW